MSGLSHYIQVKLCYLHYSIHTQSLLLLLLDIIQHPPLRIILSIHDNLRKQNHIQRNTNAIASQNMEVPPHLLNRSHRSKINDPVKFIPVVASDCAPVCFCWWLASICDPREVSRTIGL